MLSHNFNILDSRRLQSLQHETQVCRVLTCSFFFPNILSWYFLGLSCGAEITMTKAVQFFRSKDKISSNFFENSWFDEVMTIMTLVPWKAGSQLRFVVLHVFFCFFLRPGRQARYFLFEIKYFSIDVNVTNWHLDRRTHRVVYMEYLISTFIPTWSACCSHSFTPSGLSA